MPRQSNKHRKKKNKSRAKSTSKSESMTVKELLHQAEAAMDASNCSLGLFYYNELNNLIRNQLMQETTTTPTTMNGEEDKDEENVSWLLLAKVLSKSGEAKISMGDVEGGREDFSEALSVLENSKNNGNNDAGMDDMEVETNQNKNEMDTEDGMDENPLMTLSEKEEFYQVRAGIYLYLGQLSSGDEALSACQKGVLDLKKCMKCLECACQKDGKNGEIQRNGVEDVNVSSEVSLMEIRKQICSAHCTIAELYLTDLCYDPDAESKCETTLKSALHYDNLVQESSKSISCKLSSQQISSPTSPFPPPPSSSIIITKNNHPDALQALANLRLSQSRAIEASQIMMKAYTRMKKGCTAMSKLVGLGEDNDETTMEESDVVAAKELENVEEATSLPGYEFRCQSAKLLLECGSILKEQPQQQLDNLELMESIHQNGEEVIPVTSYSCCEAAVQVLGSLLAENDEVIEIWYLMGCAFQAIDDNETAKQYWERALEMLGKVKEQLQEQENDDDDEMENGGGCDEDDDYVEEQLEEIEVQMEDIQEKLLQLDTSVEMNDV